MSEQTPTAVEKVDAEHIAQAAEAALYDKYVFIGRVTKSDIAIAVRYGVSEAINAFTTTPTPAPDAVAGLRAGWKCNACFAIFTTAVPHKKGSGGDGPDCPECKAWAQYTYPYRLHFGDPCRGCGIAHDEVASGPCLAALPASQPVATDDVILQLARHRDRDRVTVLAKCGLLLSHMNGEGLYFNGFDEFEMYNDVVVALGIEDNEDPDLTMTMIGEGEDFGLLLLDDASQPVADVEAETYRQMHDTAKGMGYPSILEALEALSDIKTSLEYRHSLIGRTQAQVATLTARVETLEGALAPFGQIPIDGHNTPDGYPDPRVWQEHLRKARAALSPDPAVEPSAEGGAA